MLSDDLGWRSRAVALAALGGAQLAHDAFARSRPDHLSPLQMQLLVLLAVQAPPGTPSAGDGPELVLRLDPEVYVELLGTLVDRGLVHIAEIHDPVVLEPDLAGDEPDREADVISLPRLTHLGHDEVSHWLTRVAPLSRRWPPDRPDIDDAID